MKVIKEVSNDMEKLLDIAECFAKKATMFKEDYPKVSQTYLAASETLLDLMSAQHGNVVELISQYKKEKGEPPVPMMAVYDYVHERLIDKTAAVKKLQEVYKL